MKPLISLFFLLFVLFSCKKAENRTCYKFAGKDAVKEIPLADFNSLVLGKKMDFVLIQDSLDKVVIFGKENLIQLISTSISNDTLSIFNENKCAYFRKYSNNKIRVEIHFSSLKRIKTLGSETLICSDTLKSSSLSIEIRDGAGTSNFSVDVENLSIDAPHGWGDYVISGKAVNAIVGIRSNCFGDARNLLVSNYLYVSNDAQGDLIINANNLALDGFIKSDGNIFYVGNFTSETVVKTGKGELKPL